MDIGKQRPSNAARAEPRPAAEITYPEPPQQLRRFNIRSALAFFGPGAIVASATVGSGETIFPARGAAIFGYSIIWMLIVAIIFKGALMYVSNRYMTITGEHPLTRLAHSIPGPRCWLPIVLGLLAVGSLPFWIGGLSLAIGDYLSFLAGGSGRLWATGFLLGCGLLAWVGGYRFVEKAQLFIVGLLLIAILVAVFWARPDWISFLYGFVPQPLGYADWLADKYPAVASRPLWVETVTYLGALGGGLQDYFGYTGMLREKRWGLLGRDDILRLGEEFETLPRGQHLPLPESEHEVAKARIWSRAPRSDVMLSVTAVAVAAIAFAVNGADLLHGQQLVPSEDNLLRYQAQFLGVVFPALSYLYYVAIFFAFFGTVFGLGEVYSSATHEAVGAVFPRVRRWGLNVTRRWAYPYMFGFGLLLLWVTSDPISLVTISAIVGGVFGMGIYLLAILYSERQVLPKPYRLKGFGWGLALVSGIVLTGFGVIAILQQLGIVSGS